jgi:DNA invertase Pin-like site-specific DNA recombinase
LISASFRAGTDESNPASRLLLHVFAAFAAFGEFERELIRERVVTGIRAAQWPGNALGKAGYSGGTRPAAAYQSWRQIARPLGVQIAWKIQSADGQVPEAFGDAVPGSLQRLGSA